MTAPLTATVLLATFAAGCSAGSSSNTLLVGNDGTGGASAGPNGSGGEFMLAGDASVSTALSARIESPKGTTVQVITLACSGDCADVEAVATGGHEPYAFAWEDGSTSAARHVCPSSTTNYSVTVSDTAIGSGEFKRDAETVTVPLTTTVLSCPDSATVPLTGDGGICAAGTAPAPGLYAGTIDCPASTSSGGAAGSTGTIRLELAADGTGTLFFQWSLVVIGAQGTLHPFVDCGTPGLSENWDGFWGVPGLSDPSNPNSAPTLLPAGTITGDIVITPDSATPATISGKFDWDAPPVANQPASICHGTFTAKRAP